MLIPARLFLLVFPHLFTSHDIGQAVAVAVALLSGGAGAVLYARGAPELGLVACWNALLAIAHRMRPTLDLVPKVSVQF